MSAERPLQSSAPAPEQPDGDTHVPTEPVEPFRLGDPLPRRMTITDMCRAFNIKKSRFHQLERAGKFERFEQRPRIGRPAWSGVLVQRYLDGESGSSRFVKAS